VIDEKYLYPQFTQDDIDEWQWWYFDLGNLWSCDDWLGFKKFLRDKITQRRQKTTNA